MRTVPIAILLAAALFVPFQTACYAPRIDVCRYPVGSFEGITEVEITDIHNDFGFESASSLNYTVRARTSRSIGCVNVHSELYLRGALVETIDTPVAARSDGALVTTSAVYHYHYSSVRDLEVRVTALGATVSAPVPVPPGFDRDGSVGDAGPPTDTGARDAGMISDAPSGDTSSTDAPTSDAASDAP